MIANLIPLGYSGSSAKCSRDFASSTGVFSTITSPRCCEVLLAVEELRETGTWPFFSLLERFFSLLRKEEPLLESSLAFAVLDSSMLFGEAAFEEKVGNFILSTKSGLLI